MKYRTLPAAAALLCAAAVTLAPTLPARADQIRNDQWHLQSLNVAEAHKISLGEGVVVGLVDSGVDEHPDLRNNLLRGKDLAAGGSGDGQHDQDGHGTGMAGLIAAHGRGNDNGALGIAPRAKILPIRYARSNSDIKNSGESLAASIEWAVSNGATVINLSSSGGPSPKLQAAINMAIKADVVVVAATGNRPESYTVGFPAMYDGVVAVGAIDRSGRIAKVSVSGKAMAISAPGEDIYTTGLGGRYRKATGTSDATAIVSGAAALIRSKYPDLSAKEVIHRLTATAIDKGAPGRDPEYGYGVLDLVAALTADVPPLDAKPSASAAPSPSVDATVLPRSQQSGNKMTTLLITFGVLVAIGIVITLLVLRSRRRKST